MPRPLILSCLLAAIAASAQEPIRTLYEFNQHDDIVGYTCVAAKFPAIIGVKVAKSADGRKLIIDLDDPANQNMQYSGVRMAIPPPKNLIQNTIKTNCGAWWTARDDKALGWVTADKDGACDITIDRSNFPASGKPWVCAVNGFHEFLPSEVIGSKVTFSGTARKGEIIPYRCVPLSEEPKR